MFKLLPNTIAFNAPVKFGDMEIGAIIAWVGANGGKKLNLHFKIVARHNNTFLDTQSNIIHMASFGFHCTADANHCDLPSLHAFY